jgi:alkylation response protein AidB-like acyl-CoA dehydrogenase
MSHLHHPSLHQPEQSGEHAWIWSRLDELNQALAATAVQRDREGGHAAHERALIRDSGLLNLSTPKAFGGAGVNWQTFYRTLRQLAQVDSALAHLYAFHHLQVATVLIFGSPAQHDRLLTETVQRQLFWGNALNPSDRRAVATEVPGGFQIHGPKSYCSGSVGSDRMTVSAWHEASQSFVIGVVATQQTGVNVVADWDAFGQRQTDSGTVNFENVFVPDDDVLIRPGEVATPWVTLRAQLAQHILGSLYSGIAAGALHAGLDFTRSQSRPWSASGVSRAVDDSYVQLRYAELWLQVKAANAVSDLASAQIDQAFARGPSLQAAERGEVAVAVAEAKVLSHRAAMEVSSRFFELTGARSTSAGFGLDRFWRNARVHTLHDPIDYKLRDIGRYVLDGRHPEPTSYS